jgi:ketosteroid isomerase-like protein
MSQERVELLKRGVDAHNRRDLDAFADLCTADVEWFPSMAGAIEGGSYKGREGMERYFEHYDETWEGFRVEADEYRSVGDRVLALGRLEATGRGSGVPVSTPMGAVSEFRDGKMSRTRTYLDQAEALRAAESE